jgi:hypothetical protein
MTSPTQGNGPEGRSERSADPADDSGSRAVNAEPAEEARPATGSAAPSQSSGKQFERGTEAVPDHEPEMGTSALGPGASASGKRFARGTDSDGDGVGFDEAPGDSRT